MFSVSHLYFGRLKRPSSGWMAVTSITHHYYMITNKFENLHALQRKINTCALLPDARLSRPILAVKYVSPVVFNLALLICFKTNAFLYPLATRNLHRSAALWLNQSSLEHILRSLKAWAYGMLSLHIRGWHEVWYRYWCLSVGFMYKSVSILPLLFITWTSR